MQTAIVPVPVPSRAPPGRRLNPRHPPTDAVWAEAMKHRPLVVTIAKTFVNRRYSATLEDLIDDGMIGLCRAVEGFKPDRGVKFGTYATWAVKRHIRQAISQGYRVIHTNKWIDSVALRVRYFGLDVATLPVGTQRSVEMALQSMDAKIYTPQTVFGQFILGMVPEQESDAEWPEWEQSELLERGMAVLGDRDREIIRLYFGLDGPKMTLQEIGEKHKLSKERVRQIKKRVLAVLHEELAGCLE